MYRYDEDAVQPENGNKARYDPDAAIAQRDRWVASALEALQLEAISERYADDLFPEPYPSDPDEGEPSGSFSDLSETWVSARVKPDVTTQPDATDPEPPKPAPARSTEVQSSDSDQHRNAYNAFGNAHSHKAVRPYVSIVANVVFFTAGITAGMIHVLSSKHSSGRDNHAARLTALFATLLGLCRCGMHCCFRGYICRTALLVLNALGVLATAGAKATEPCST
eukprot:192687-Pleurochrysis_carterae.AAC.1